MTTSIENVNSTSPYWARETALHEDLLAGTVAGKPDYGLPYNYMTPPRSTDGQTPSVKVGLNLFKIQEIDLARSEMSLNVWLRMTWNDPRLSWNATEQRYYNVEQTTFSASTDIEQTKIWVPDLELYNQAESISETFPMKDAQVWPDGTVFWSRVGLLKSLCSFSGLKKHPFDKTECTVEFGGWARSGYFANYEFMDPPVAYGGTGTATATYQEYTLIEEDGRANIEVFFYPCCPGEPWPTLSYTFVFTRASNYYFKTLVLPNILFAFFASAVFWLDVRCGERLGFGITVLLAMVATEIIAAESLPTCSEWLWIEVMSGGAVFIAFACLMESCVVTYIYYQQRKEDVTEFMNVGKSKKNDDNDEGEDSRRNEGEDSRKWSEGEDSWNENPTHNASAGAKQRANANSQSGDDALDHAIDERSDGGVEIRKSQTLMVGDISEEEPDPESAPRLKRRSSTLRERVSQALLSVAGSKYQPTKEEQTAEERAKRWREERNLTLESFRRVKEIDRFSFKVFICVYPTFLVVMFATLPTWSDDYAINL